MQSGTIHLSHKIALEPTVKQLNYFVQAAGTARFVWNYALSRWNELYVAGDSPSGKTLAAAFNAIKYEQFPWLKGIHRDAHSRPFIDLGKAFQKFFNKSAKRPKFKCKGRSRDSFYVANDKLTLKGRRVRLPVIGWVKLTEPLRFTGKIMSAVVSRTADRWFISIQVDVGNYTKPRTGHDTVGVDLGIKILATLSTEEQIANPQPLKTNLAKLRRLSRSLAKKQKGSQNRTKAKLKLARCHARIHNIRQDCLHKLTTKLCRENQAVVIEDLCVKGMLRNRSLARAISDVGFGEFRRQLEYKSQIYGTKILVVDRFFPSSKTCSCCGHVKKQLSLSDRIYECGECGLIIDRDLNAALNLRTAGLAGIACGPEGSGNRRETGVKPRRVEAGTKPRSLVSAD